MSKNVNPYRIYLKATRQWVEVSEEYYRNHTRYYDAFRKRHQSHGQCICPKNKFWLCDGDCYNCEYRRAGDNLSLDYKVEDGEGNEKSWLDDLPDTTPDAQSVLEDRELLDALYRRLEELDPEGRRICQLIMAGKSERESAEIMGLARSTYKRHREKLMADLFESLKNYI